MGDPGYDFRNAVGRADETDELAGYQHIPQQCVFRRTVVRYSVAAGYRSDFSIANLPAVFIGHSFEYNSWSKVYKDVRGTYTDDRYERDDKGNFVPARDLEYYKNWFINPTQTRDSIYERVVSNRVFIQAQPGIATVWSVR